MQQFASFPCIYYLNTQHLDIEYRRAPPPPLTYTQQQQQQQQQNNYHLCVFMLQIMSTFWKI